MKSGEQQMLDEVTIQVYEAKTRDLTEQLSRYKNKCQVLLTENSALGNVQSKFSQDRQDIVEFLNIKLQEQEKHATAQEEVIRLLQNDKKELEVGCRVKIEGVVEQSKIEVEQMNIQCAKYKTDLDQLSEFRGRKDDLDKQIRVLNGTLEQKEKEYKDIIHTMERKILQDKNVMKKEMLQKVNEAVANFRRVADQQMAETTKRAIRENMAITSQLKKMSAKTMELLSENESLSATVAKTKMDNSLLVESERDLARKNQANQRVVKMLVEKIRESDKMIEIAYDTGIITNDSRDSIQKKMDNDNGFNFGNDKKDDIFGGFSFSITAPFAEETPMNPNSVLSPIPPSEEAEKEDDIDSSDNQESIVKPVSPVAPPSRKIGQVRVIEPIKETKKSVPVPVVPRLRQRSLRDPTIMTIVRHIPSSKKILEERAERRERGEVVSAEKRGEKKVASVGELLGNLRPWGKQSQVLPKKVGDTWV